MKPERNDPCPCGSGRKYKKCCGAAANPEPSARNDLGQALALLQAGRAGEALALCTAILRGQPSHPGALELAGMIHYQAGEFAAARLYFERSVSANAQDIHASTHLAQVLCDLHEFDTAETHVRRALALDDWDADAHNILGNILVARAAWHEASGHYRQAIAADPQRPTFHHNLGHALQQLGDRDAEDAYRQAIVLEPRFAPAYVNLGGLLVKQDRNEEARDLLRRAIALAPENIDAYNNLGLANRKLGNLSEAFGAYRTAVEKNPEAAGVWHNLGLLYEEGLRYVEAMDCFKRAVELDPEFMEAQRDWLNGLLRAGDLDTAHAVASRLMADTMTPGSILSIILDVFGRSADFAGRDRAIERFRDLFRSGRYPPRTLTSLLMQLQYPANLDEQENLSYHRLWGEAIEREVADKRFSAWSSWQDTELLRIGYLSPDFRHHSVGYFIQHVLAQHDRRRFEVYCYANQRTNDEVTARIRAVAAHYTEVRDLNDQQLAQRIHDDGIQILVDLAGHSAETRLDALALRPAPLQCTWIGYLNTTGLKAIDYRITDPWADDPAAAQGTEQLLLLPESFLCIGSFPEAAIAESPACVRNGYVTFASFNNLSKLTPEVVRLWARVMQAAPGAKMLIISKGADAQITKAHLYAEFARHGIEQERLLLRKSVAREQYLEAHNGVDIFLDTFPFNGGTITAGALWMGVPVVTLVGKPHRQRMGYSMLKNIGVEDTVAWGEDEYVDIAAGLAQDPARLGRLRHKIAAGIRSSVLCDPARFTRQYEDALRQVWRERLAREEPGSH